MTKQEFLAFSLPYGLKLFNKNCEYKRMYEMDGLFTPNAVHCKETNRVDYFHCEIMPILRPLSDLVREIEHNGEKFVPLLELAKIAFDGFTCSTMDYSKTNSSYKVTCKDCEFSYNYKIYSFSLYDNALREYQYFPFQLKLFQKLIEWHFDIADFISKGEAIDVNTLDINPYK